MTLHYSTILVITRRIQDVLGIFTNATTDFYLGLGFRFVHEMNIKGNWKKVSSFLLECLYQTHQDDKLFQVCSLNFSVRCVSTSSTIGS